MELAAIGATESGGVNRQALTDRDGEGRLLLLEWARQANLEPSIDAIGNMFFRRRGQDNDAAPVMTGSHLDSEPTGGRFDGVYGVLAGLELLQVLHDAKIETLRPIELVVWTNEEGCRFQPGCMGSAAYCDPDRLAQFLETADADGITVDQELQALRRRVPNLPEHPLGMAPAAFIEAHIEQGPVLEANKSTIGVVSGIQGLRRYNVVVDGEAAHGGTTPRATRKDALLQAVDIVSALRDLVQDPEDTIRFTVGRFLVSPNSPSVVPARVEFTVDVRHNDAATLTALGKKILETCVASAGRCSVSIEPVSLVAPVVFRDSVQQLIRDAAVRQRLSHFTLPSGAGHDARHLAQLSPAGMIFIPCLHGISHNAAESVEPEHLAAGARVLAEVIIELADSPKLTLA
jgi:N-carbamoyl-L-amino-acid hydrolase